MKKYFFILLLCSQAIFAQVNVPFYGNRKFISNDRADTLEVNWDNTGIATLKSSRPVSIPSLVQQTEQLNADWEATSGAAQIFNKPILFDGNYNSLSNKPALFSLPLQTGNAGKVLTTNGIIAEWGSVSIIDSTGILKNINGSIVPFYNKIPGKIYGSKSGYPNSSTDTLKYNGVIWGTKLKLLSGATNNSTGLFIDPISTTNTIELVTNNNSAGGNWLFIRNPQNTKSFTITKDCHFAWRQGSVSFTTASGQVLSLGGKWDGNPGLTISAATGSLCILKAISDTYGNEFNVNLDASLLLQSNGMRLASFKRNKNGTILEKAYIDSAGNIDIKGQYKINGVAISTGGSTYTHPDTHPSSMITGLATVAASGDYNDLVNKPTITNLPVQTNNAGKVLTTDGTNASWSSVPVTDSTGMFKIVNGSIIPFYNKGAGKWFAKRIEVPTSTTDSAKFNGVLNASAFRVGNNIASIDVNGKGTFKGGVVSTGVPLDSNYIKFRGSSIYLGINNNDSKIEISSQNTIIGGNSFGNFTGSLGLTVALGTNIYTAATNYGVIGSVLIGDYCAYNVKKGIGSSVLIGRSVYANKYNYTGGILAIDNNSDTASTFIHGDMYADTLRLNAQTRIGKGQNYTEVSVGGKLTTTQPTINIAVSKTPTSSSAPGTKGDICWDTNYVYICVETNTWKRSPINSW